MFSIIVVLTCFIVFMAYGGHKYRMRNREVLESPLETSEYGIFYRSLPVRCSYKSLLEATNNFSVKLGQGGFGSIYQGKLLDGTLLAMKRLKRVGQGKKEFQAEGSIIGSAIHPHPSRQIEGKHRFLDYEFKANRSLDKLIFKRNGEENPVLYWATRFNMTIGTVKGLAYLHEGCEVKIVRCG